LVKKVTQAIAGATINSKFLAPAIPIQAACPLYQLKILFDEPTKFSNSCFGGISKPFNLRCSWNIERKVTH